MKSTIQLVSIWLPALYVFTSCTALYVPITHNTPMFSNKNEFQASVGIGLGLNVQAAYSVTDHWGLTANYLYGNSKDETQGRVHQSCEIGLGYYSNFNDQWCFELFAGYGLGKGHAFDSAYDQSDYDLFSFFFK